jgi:iron complex outermembrane receptor protein
MRRLRHGVFCLLASAQYAVWADILPEVVVEETETVPRVGDVVLSETTAATTIISGEVLSRPGTTLAQVLSREAGVQIRTSGGLGSYSTATLRGASSDQVMVYLDGLVLNSGAGGGFNLADIELMQVDRIEIYRGSTPVQLSRASLGGAINLRSLEGDEASGWRGTVGSGSFDTRQAGVLLQGVAGEAHGLVSLNAQRSDNDFPFRNDNGTVFNPEDDFDDHRRNAAIDQSSLLLKLERPLDSSVRQDVSLHYFNKSQQIPDQKNSAYNHALLDTQTLRLQFNQRYDAIRQSQWNSRIGFNISRKHEEYRDLQSAIGLGRQHSRWRTDTAGIDNYWEHVGEVRSFLLSADLRQENYHQDDLLDNRPESEARRRELSLALQESLFFLNDHLLLAPELRYQATEDDFDVSVMSFAGTSLDRRVSHREWSPKLGARYALNDFTTLSVNIGRYQRLPSFFELFGDRGLFLGNESLKPESGLNIDMGIRWENRGLVGYFNNPSVQLGLFYSDVEDAISRVYNARGIGKSINIEGALIQGIEWDLRGDLGRRTHLQIKGTFQDTENRSFIPAFRGKQLPGQAQTTLNLYFDYRWRKARFYYQYAGKYDAWYDTANLLPARDQSVHTAGLKYPLQQFELAIELANFTDDIYEDFNGYPKPGRAFYLTMSYPGEKRE